MSDQNTSLPVRTENNGDVVVKLSDATTPSQQLAVDSTGRITIKAQDGNGNALTSQSNGAQRALDVGIDVAGVQVDPRQIRTLTSADVVTANQGTAAATASAWPTKITDGTNVSAVKAASTAATATDPSLVVALSPNSPVPSGTNNIGKVSIQDSTGAAINSSNPLAVSIVDSLSGVTYINDYNTVSAIAAGATSNHDYTITSTKTFKGYVFWASASGKLKIEVQTSPDGTTFASKWVGFNSTGTPNISINLGNLSISDSGVGSKIRIIRTNLDKQAQDVYSTISGTEQ